MIQVPFYDMSALHAEIENELEAAALRVLRSHQYIGGGEVESFEKQFSEYVGAEHCIGVANGLSAIHLTLVAMGIGSGDEVIVPSNTFIATWLAVSHCGAKPIPVEPDPLTHTISAESIKKKIGSRTKALIPVHLYGQSVDLDPILQLAKENNLFVIEDAAQAHGAKYKGQALGCHSDAVTWSFYPGKNLGALGDAGGITTNNKELAETIILLRNYGSSQRYKNDLIGYNSRLDPLQAALLSIKLKKLDQWNSKRRETANYYSTHLNDDVCIIPNTPSWSTPVWHQYVIRSKKREDLQIWLKKQGVETLIHYPIPPHNQLCYKDQSFPDLPIAEMLASEVLSLPIFPHITTTQIEAVVSAVNKFIEQV